jgi:hypothetical protein
MEWSVFWDRLQTEWETLYRAPWGILAMLALGGLVGLLFGRLHYAEVVRTLKEAIGTLEHGLSLKGYQMKEYRERLDLTSKLGQDFSMMSAEILKEKAYLVINGMKELLSEFGREKEALCERYENTTNSTELDQETKRPLPEFFDKALKLGSNMSLKYHKHFKRDAIILCEELMSRTPGETRDKERTRKYEQPVGPGTILEIVTDLEGLAQKLK